MTHLHTRKPLNITPLLLILLSIAGSLSVLIWGFNKAFDLTDAGYYLLRYQDNQPLEAGGFLYDHILIKAMLPNTWRHIIPLRVFGMVLNLVSTLLLSLAVFSLSKKWGRHTESLKYIFWLIYAGFVFSYAGSPGELSYNTLNQFLIISAAALLIISQSSRGAAKLAIIFCAGFLTSISLLIKLPSGLTAAIAGVVFLLFTAKNRWYALLSFKAGIIFSLAIVYLTVKPDFMEYFITGYLTIGKGNEYGSKLLIYSLYEICLRNLYVFLIAFAANLALWFAALQHKPKIKQFIQTAVFIILAIFFGKSVIQHFQGSMFVSDTLMFIVYLLVFRLVFSSLSPASLFPKTSKSSFTNAKGKAIALYIRENYQSLAPLIYLLILPYIGALGTNNPLNWGAKFYYSATLGALALLSALHYSKLLKITTCCLAAYLMILGVAQYVQYPYRSKALYTQKYAFHGIKLDYNKMQYLQEIESALKDEGFVAEQGIIVAYKNPGLVYLLHSYHPGGVLWSKETEDAYFALLQHTSAPMKPLIIGNDKPITKSFAKKLFSATGIIFSTDYRLVKKIRHYEPGKYTYLYLPIAAQK
ncbi:MAG: hypothetical protein PHO32_01680 [Candidatus Cloacimonetes bacterium]|nr:hypothetical protein [Candidatus Cloacimonadota bacterium]